MEKYKLIEKFVSTERISTYLLLADNNTNKSIDLYINNIRVSEKIYGLISQFEVIFRNCINDQLIIHYGNEWYDNPKLKLIDIHITAIARVKADLAKEKKKISNPNIISNLNLGFWVYLFNTDYDKTLWRTCFYKVFSNKRALNRSRVRLELDKIKKLRNRVAHCECILKYPYDKYSKEIIEFIGWINPQLADWIVEVCDLDFIENTKP